MLADLEAYAAASDPSKLVAPSAAAASGADKARDSESSLQRNRTFSALNALIRQQPEVVNAAVAKIRSGSPAARVLVSGLASSGSAEAQQSLVMLLDDATLDMHLRKAIGVSLLQANQPTVASARAIEALLADPSWRQFASYGLGTFARRLRDVGEVQESQRLVQELTRLLTSTKNQQEMKDLLAGLANAGSIDALPAIRPFLENPEVLRCVKPPCSACACSTLAARAAADPRLSADAAATVRATAIEDAGRRDAASETLTRAISKAASTMPTCRFASPRAHAGEMTAYAPRVAYGDRRHRGQGRDPSVLIVAKTALTASTAERREPLTDELVRLRA